MEDQRKCVSCRSTLSPPQQTEASKKEKSSFQEFCEQILRGKVEEFWRVQGNEIETTCEVCQQKLTSILETHKNVAEGEKKIEKLCKELGQKINELVTDKNAILENLETFSSPETLGLDGSVTDNNLIFLKGIVKAKDKLNGAEMRDALTAAGTAVNKLSHAISGTSWNNSAIELTSSLQQQPRIEDGFVKTEKEIESGRAQKQILKIPPPVASEHSEDENVTVGREFRVKTEIPPEEVNEKETRSSQNNSMSQCIVEDVVKVEMPDPPKRKRRIFFEEESEDRREYDEDGQEVIRRLRGRIINGFRFKGDNLTSWRIRAANKNQAASCTNAKKTNEDPNAEMIDIGSDSDDGANPEEKDERDFNQIEEPVAAVIEDEGKPSDSDSVTSQPNPLDADVQVPENFQSDEEALNNSVSLLSQADIQIQNADRLSVASVESPTKSAQIPQTSNEESTALPPPSLPSPHAESESTEAPQMSRVRSIGKVDERREELNIKGCCFLCLKTDTTIQTKNEKPVSLKCVLRHLKIEVPNRSLAAHPNCEDGTEEDIQKKQEEFEADLCESCEGIVNNFSKSFLSLEKFQMDVSYWLERIRQQISEASRKPELKQNYSERMTSDPETLAQLVVLDNLRKEISRKSSTKRVGSEAKIYLHRSKWTPKKQDLENHEDCGDQMWSQTEPDAFNENIYSEDDQSNNLLSMDDDNEDVGMDSPVAATIKLEKRETLPPLAPSEPHAQSQLVPSTVSKMYVRNQTTGSYFCTSCNKQLKSKLAAKLHYEAIHLGKRYTCQVCESTFTTRQHLKNHKKICNGKKRRSFSHSNIKKWHVDSQTRKFVCAVCSKEFGAKSSAYYHYEATHLKKKHKCEFCTIAVYSLRHNLIKHQKTCEATLKKRLAKKLASKENS